VSFVHINNLKQNLFENISGDPRAWASQTLWRRSWVLIENEIYNFLFATSEESNTKNTKRKNKEKKTYKRSQRKEMLQIHLFVRPEQQKHHW